MAFAMASGPWFSILAGGPVFYLLGRVLLRLVGGKARAAGIAAWALYSAVDAAVVLTATDAISAPLAGQWVLSQAIKLLAVLWATQAPASAEGP